MVYYSFVRTNQYDHVPLCHHDYVNVAVQALSDTSHNWLSLKSEERRPHGHGGLGLDLRDGSIRCQVGLSTGTVLPSYYVYR